ncbi:MAG: (2Fe-2S) ferredoxin domain-containing protein [Desulfamplus sp.]|nr:(2Fe-2S) ferredoxin domain-containing protein [Desulfamplus sp.]
MAKLTIEDLKRIKKENSHIVALRSGASSVNMTVHMGECGVKAGARDVMHSLLEAKAASGRDDIKIVAGPCMGQCSTEPDITIEIKGSKPVIYQKMNPEKASKIFSHHILGGNVQTEYLLAT